ALASCDTDGTTSAVSGRHMQPLSDRMLAEIESKNMAKESPILVRIFKEESEFEVWKEDKSGRFALLHTYPICRWSGELGPKIKQGDRQAPEGFYTITPGLMNPNSNYYLAINTGFPNAYDRANGRTGAFLMIHGDCSSAGCYAMTDEQIAEIYALARESFFGGQRSFQIQAYPFKMTPLNMAKHRNSPHMAFWKMLKEGYDYFEVTRAEPKVDVCEKRYVFGAEPSAKFSPADRCPAYRIPDEIATAVREKQHRDETQTAELISRGTATVPVKMGVDGGMNAAFMTAVKSHGGPGAAIRTAAGTIPPHVNPPGFEPPAETMSASTLSLASAESKPASGPRSSVQVASAVPGSSGGVGSFFSNLFGSKAEDPPPTPPRRPRRNRTPPRPGRSAGRAPPARPGRSPSRRRQRPKPRMRRPNPRRRNRKRTPSRRKTQGALRACSAVPPRPSPPAASTIGSAPGTEDHARGLTTGNGSFRPSSMVRQLSSA